MLALDVDRAGLEETKLLSIERGGDLKVLQCDVADSESVKSAFEFSEKEFGHCTIMVAAAGIALYTDYLSMGEKDMDRTIAVNVKGPLLCAQESLRQMEKAGKGSIIFISSVQAVMSLFGCVVYAATKSGPVGRMSWPTTMRPDPPSLERIPKTSTKAVPTSRDRSGPH